MSYEQWNYGYLKATVGVVPLSALHRRTSELRGGPTHFAKTLLRFPVRSSDSFRNDFAPGCPLQAPSEAPSEAYLIDMYYSGGCQPTLTQRWRTATIIASFMFKPTIVARPIAVKPKIRVPVSFHAKCSCQFCRRGWYSRTTSPVNGS